MCPGSSLLWKSSCQVTAVHVRWFEKFYAKQRVGYPNSHNDQLISIPSATGSPLAVSLSLHDLLSFLVNYSSSHATCSTLKLITASTLSLTEHHSLTSAAIAISISPSCYATVPSGFRFRTKYLQRSRARKNSWVMGKQTCLDWQPNGQMRLDAKADAGRPATAIRWTSIGVSESIVRWSRSTDQIVFCIIAPDYYTN